MLDLRFFRREYMVNQKTDSPNNYIEFSSLKREQISTSPCRGASRNMGGQVGSQIMMTTGSCPLSFPPSFLSSFLSLADMAIATPAGSSSEKTMAVRNLRITWRIRRLILGCILYRYCKDSLFSIQTQLKYNISVWI